MPNVAELAAEVEVKGVPSSTAQLATFGQSVDKTAARAGSAAASHAKHEQALRMAGTGAMVAGGLLVAGFGLAVGATVRFDKAMSNVGAVSGATGTELGKLREAAIEAGAATVFSASEAAQAEAELAKAGVNTADILGGALRGSLDLAAAGQIDLASSATIAAQAMNIFDLSGRDVAHVADVLAAGANKSAADVGQLGEAMRMGGLLAKQTGVSFEETIGTLAMFADNALIGSDAGTSLKTMLQRLTPQSDEARAMMDQLGISAYDAQGNFVGLEKFAGSLQTAMRDLTPEQRNAAMAVIFGADAVRAANILYEAGPKGVREYTQAVNDQGAAGRMAGAQLDNLAGDLEQLSGSIETSLIQGGSKATGALRGITQGATDLVNGFGQLPGPVQTAGIAFAGVGGTALIAAGGFLRMKLFMDQLQVSAPRTANAIGTIGRAAGIVAGVVAAVSLVGLALDKLGLSAKKTVVTVRDMERASLGTPERLRGAFAAMVLESGNAEKSFRELASASPALARELIGAMVATDGKSKATRRMREILGEEIATSRKSAEQNKANQAALEGTGNAANGAALDVDKLKNAITGFMNVEVAAETSRLQFEAGLASIREEIAAGTFTLDMNTSAGIRNQQGLMGLATEAKNHAASVFEQTQNVDAANMVLGGHYNQLFAVARQTHATDQEAAAYTLTLFGVPPDVATQVTNTADPARAGVEFLLGRLAELLPKRTTPTDVDTGQAHAKLDALFTRLRDFAATRVTAVADVVGGGFRAPGGQHGLITPGPASRAYPAVLHGHEAVVPLGTGTVATRDRERIAREAGLYDLLAPQQLTMPPVQFTGGGDFGRGGGDTHITKNLNLTLDGVIDRPFREDVVHEYWRRMELVSGP